MAGVSYTKSARCTGTYHVIGTAPVKKFCGRLSGQLELGAAPSRKAVWWDLHLAILLMHLLLLSLSFLTCLPSEATADLAPA